MESIGTRAYNYGKVLYIFIGKGRLYGTRSPLADHDHFLITQHKDLITRCRPLSLHSDCCRHLFKKNCLPSSTSPAVRQENSTIKEGKANFVDSSWDYYSCLHSSTHSCCLWAAFLPISASCTCLPFLRSPDSEFASINSIMNLKMKQFFGMETF